MSTSATVAENKLPKGDPDNYGGGVVKMNENGPMDSNLFGSLLETSLSHWRPQVLVVQENSGRFQRTGIWKILPGAVEQSSQGEDTCLAAVREVKEETSWMPLKEYSEQPYVQKQELLKYIIDISLAKLEGGYRGFSPVPTSSIFSDGKDYFYFNAADLKPHG